MKRQPGRNRDLEENITSSKHESEETRGITKTVSDAFPCKLIQLTEYGCAPDDVYTLGYLLLISQISFFEYLHDNYISGFTAVLCI